MNRFVFRFKAMLLLVFLAVSITIEPVSPRVKNMLTDAGISAATQFAGLFLKNIGRKSLLKQTKCYSQRELNHVKRIIEPYVSADELTDILSCIRKPLPLSQLDLVGPCAFLDIIVISPKLLIDKSYKTIYGFTDVERAYLILHEYGHKINNHYNSKADFIRAVKVLCIQSPMIALQSYIPKFKCRALLSWCLSLLTTSVESSLLERAKEFQADEYAFNALKVDAPAGSIAIEKTYKNLFAQKNMRMLLPAMTDDSVTLKDKFKANLIDFSHPTLWARYQHACKVAKKYGWTPEAVVA